MKVFFAIFIVCFSLSSSAGSHGNFSLNCTSTSLRTHLLMELNDYDFDDKALFPQRIILSVMGNMSIFDEHFGLSFKTINKNGLLEIHSTDDDKSHVFKVDFRKNSSAQVIIEKARNPRTGDALNNLTLECKKSHNL